MIGSLVLFGCGGGENPTDKDIETDITFENGAFATAPKEPPIRVVGKNRKWLCNSTMTRELRDIVFEETKEVARRHSLPDPARSLCEFEIGDLFGATTYTVTHWPDAGVKGVCNRGGKCANMYMMLLASYQGRPARSYTLIGPDAGTTYKACIFWNGAVASQDKNCLELK